MINTNQVKPIFTYGLNTNVVRRLNALAPMDFIEQSAKVIQDAINIPKSIRPNLAFQSALPENSPIGYAFCTNDILITKRVLSNDKPTIFSQLVHELTHCFHNMQILRTKKLGKEAITTYSLLTAGRTTQSNFQYIEGLSKKALKREAQSSPPEAILNLINAIKSRKQNNISKAYLSLFNQIFNENVSILNRIRSVLIAQKGAIDDASDCGTAARNFFKSFLSSNVLEEGFSKEKYCAAITEQIAHLEQKTALSQYRKLNAAIQKAPATCQEFPAGQSLL